MVILILLYVYFSRWLEISKLKSMKSSEIVDKLKEIFSESGIPSVVIADHVTFGSYEFKTFAEKYKFKLITSIPH